MLWRPAHSGGEGISMPPSVAEEIRQLRGKSGANAGDAHHGLGLFTVATANAALWSSPPPEKPPKAPKGLLAARHAPARACTCRPGAPSLCRAPGCRCGARAHRARQAADAGAPAWLQQKALMCGPTTGMSHWAVLRLKERLHESLLEDHLAEGEAPAQDTARWAVGTSAAPAWEEDRQPFEPRDFKRLCFELR